MNTDRHQGAPAVVRTLEEAEAKIASLTEALRISQTWCQTCGRREDQRCPKAADDDCFREFVGGTRVAIVNPEAELTAGFRKAARDHGE